MLEHTNIIFDFNNVAITALHNPSVGAASGHMDIEYWHHLMFSRLHTFITETIIDRKSAARVFIACDTGGESWRHKIYAPYKANRVKDANIPWDLVWASLQEFKDIITEYLPWYLLVVQNAEADDIIAVLIDRFEKAGDKSVIFSADADYLQLWSEHTRIFRAHAGTYVDFPGEIKVAGTNVFCENPAHFLELSVMTGQGRKDNVYNIKTPTDWEADGIAKRKPPFGVKAAEKVLMAQEGKDAYLEKIGCSEHYARNKQLIDFACIPENVSCDICAALETAFRTNLNNDFKGFVSAKGWSMFDDMLEDYDELYKLAMGNKYAQLLA